MADEGFHDYTLACNFERCDQEKGRGVVLHKSIALC